MVKPIQRLPKYVLLLRDLLKHTPKDHADYENIVKCLKSFEDINNANNENMDKIIKSNKIYELEKLFGLSLSSKTYMFEE